MLHANDISLLANQKGWKRQRQPPPKKKAGRRQSKICKQMVLINESLHLSRLAKSREAKFDQFTFHRLNKFKCVPLKPNLGAPNLPLQVHQFISLFAVSAKRSQRYLWPVPLSRRSAVISMHHRAPTTNQSRRSADCGNPGSWKPKRTCHHICSMTWGVLYFNVDSGRTGCATALLEYCTWLSMLWAFMTNVSVYEMPLSHKNGQKPSRILDPGSWQNLWHFLEILAGEGRKWVGKGDINAMSYNRNKWSIFLISVRMWIPIKGSWDTGTCLSASFYRTSSQPVGVETWPSSSMLNCDRNYVHAYFLSV